MKIKKLSLENVGVFDSLEIDFPAKKDFDKAEIHILTGPNGSGKSTILYALAAGFGKHEFIEKRFRLRKERPFLKIYIRDRPAPVRLHDRS